MSGYFSHCSDAVDACGKYKSLDGCRDAVCHYFEYRTVVACNIFDLSVGRFGLIVEHHVSVVRKLIIGIHTETAKIVDRISHDVEFEMIAKLIIEIEANKNYSNTSSVTKAFDRIINQGWLHFDSIEKGMRNEN